VLPLLTTGHRDSCTADASPQDEVVTGTTPIIKRYNPRILINFEMSDDKDTEVPAMLFGAHLWCSFSGALCYATFTDVVMAYGQACRWFHLFIYSELLPLTLAVSSGVLSRTSNRSVLNHPRTKVTKVCLYMR
jgi:hypothetical protein